MLDLPLSLSLYLLYLLYRCSRHRMYLIYHQYSVSWVSNFNKATFLTFAATVNCAENRQLPELSAFQWSLACENRRFFLFSLIVTSGGEERGQTTVGCSVTITCRVIQGRYLRYVQAFCGWIGAHIFSLQLSRHGPADYRQQQKITRMSKSSSPE